MATDKKNLQLFTRPRAEQREASGAYLPVLARVEIDGATKSFQVLQVYSNQYGRVQIDASLDGSLHLIGSGGGLGEFSLVCIDGPFIDCHVREGAGTAKQVVSDIVEYYFTPFGPAKAIGRLLKRIGRSIEKAWSTHVSRDPYKTESPLEYYINDTKSLEKRYAKISIYTKFESWQASDTNDKSLTTMLDTNKQGCTGVFHGIVKDVRVDSPGAVQTPDLVITTLTLVGTWAKE